MGLRSTVSTKQHGDIRTRTTTTDPSTHREGVRAGWLITLPTSTGIQSPQSPLVWPGSEGNLARESWRTLAVCSRVLSIADASPPPC